MGKIAEYYYASSCRDAVERARALDSAAAYVGGGVELVLRRNPGVTTLIDLGRCGLSEIRETDEGIDIGALATLTAMSHSVPLQHYAHGSVAHWAGRVASNNLRDMITVGGAVARNQPWNDMVPHLLALDAQVHVLDDEERTVPLREFLRSKRGSALVMGILLPKANADAFGYLWRFTRTEQDIPLLHVSACLHIDTGVIGQASIVVGGRPGHAEECPQLSSQLTGHPVDHAAFAPVIESAGRLVDVGDDLRASGAYRRDLLRAALTGLEEFAAEVMR